MNVPISLTVSVSAVVFGNVIKKYFSSKTHDNNFVKYAYTAITSVTAVLVLLCMGNNLSLSWFTTGVALLFGVLTAVQSLAILKAYQMGSFACTSVIISLSMLIPTLLGAVIWKEPIAWVQWIGVALMAACFVLSSDLSAEDKKASKQWLLYCIIAFLCTGAIGVMQKWHQKSVYKSETVAFLLIAFAVSFVYATASALSCKDKKLFTDIPTPNYTKAVLVGLCAIGGVCIALNNIINLCLSGAIESVIFFPIVNGVPIVCTVLASCVLFKEKLSKKQWLGIALGIVSVILLCNPFA